MRALLKIIRRWWRPDELAPEAIIQLRHFICLGCDRRRRGWFRTYCAKCGCTINDKAKSTNKLAHPDEHCPENKWDRFDV